MDDDIFNSIRISQAELNVALPALKELFENQWNKKYPDTKWTGDSASVLLFEKRAKEEFENELKRLSKGERGKKNARKKQIITLLQDNKWKNYKWDISKLVYALIDSKLFKLDETGDTGIPLSEHIVEIRNIRNRSAHQTDSYCSKEKFEDTLKSLSEHIKAFEIVNIDASKYIKEIECIKSKEVPMSERERYKLQLEHEKLKFSNLMYEQKEKTSDEMKKKCELQEKIIVMQAEHTKEVNYWKSKYDKIKEEKRELEIVNLNLRQSVEIKRLKDDIQNTRSLKYENIPLTDLKISSAEFRKPKSKQNLNRNACLFEKPESSANSHAPAKNISKRNARSMEIYRVQYNIVLADIQVDTDDVKRPHFEKISQRSRRSLPADLERLQNKRDT